jgi:hypothetical protein
MKSCLNFLKFLNFFTDKPAQNLHGFMNNIFWELREQCKSTGIRKVKQNGCDFHVLMAFS